MASEQKDKNAKISSRLAALEAVRAEHRRTEERLAEIHKFFLSFQPDPTQNINRLIELAGKLFGATCALYNRLKRGLLWSTAQWNAPPDYNPVDKPEGHICYDVIQRGGSDVFLIRNLSQTDYAHTDPNVSS